MDAETAPDEIPVWVWLIGSLSAVALLTFSIGWSAIDSPEPNQAAAFPWYVFTLMIGSACIIGAVLLRGNHVLPLVLGSSAAVLIGISTASVAEEEYGSLGLEFYYAIFLLPAIILLYGVTLLVLGLRSGKEGLADACIIWGVGMGAGGALAALYHMLTISRQVELAREAHESPFGALAVVIALGAMALLARRSR